MNTPRTTAADNQDHATQIIAEYMRRVDAGEKVDREQFLRQHPDVAKELDRFLDNVALVEQMAGPALGEQPQSPGDVGPTEQARRETVAGTQSGDSVPEKTGIAVGSLKSGKFGRYQVEKTLGEGAMGTVYLARDTELDRRVALKVPKFGDDDQEMMERFYREARSAAKLRHRNICAVHDIGEIDGTRYISMAYIEGRPLSDYVNPDKPPSERNVAVIVRKLAQALETAHREGVIHRDLKPANIMVDKKTEPVIMDFGLARQINKQEDERLTQTGTVMGSPAYMSPEQVNADIDRIGPASDIYSLGVILYELLTGRLPYEGSIAAVIGQILMKDPEKPSAHRANLDPRLESICTKMMAKQIDDRHTTMKEVVQALTEFLKNEGKTDGPRPVEKLESFEPVEQKSVARETAIASRKSTKGRRTVARRPREDHPVETFPTINQASEGRKSPGSPKRLSAIDRLGNIPGWAWGSAGAFGTLALVLAITLIFRAGDQVVEIVIDDPSAEITVDGRMIEIVSKGDEGFGKVTAKPGKYGYEWEVERDGQTISGNGSLTINKGDRTPIRIVTRDAKSSDGDAVNSGGPERSPKVAGVPTGIAGPTPLNPTSNAVKPGAATPSKGNIRQPNNPTDTTAPNQIPADAPVTAVAPVDDTWTELFNDKSLSGWKGLNGLWKVENGELVGASKRNGLKFNTCLVSDRRYQDFEIQFEVKLTGTQARKPANSGLQIRSRLIDPDKFIMSGAQVDIGRSGLSSWGSLWGENVGGMMKRADGAVVKRVLRPGDFNAFYVTCQGKRVSITINGTTVIDQEFPSLPEEGLLGWQLHGGRVMAATFRNVRIRELGKNGKPSAPTIPGPATQPPKDLPTFKTTAKLTRVALLEGTAVSPYAKYAFAISPDGSVVLDSMTPNGILRTRNVATGRVTLLPFRSPENVTAAAFSADGDTLLIGTSKGRVYVQPLARGKRAVELVTGFPEVRKVAFDTEGRVLAFSNGESYTVDGAVQRFDVKTQKVSKVVVIPQRMIYNPCSVSFAPDGNRVAVVRVNRPVLYDLDSEEPLPTSFEAHRKLPSEKYDWSWGVSLSPNGQRLMTWGYDRKIRVSNAITGKRILPLLVRSTQVQPPQLPTEMYASRGLLSADGRWFAATYTTGVNG
ncbi:MAG: protein kinase, partial [Planctomycetaceae bacterium]|nr:protein kinase [Planctomycetaceae bacterium]